MMFTLPSPAFALTLFRGGLVFLLAILASAHARAGESELERQAGRFWQTVAAKAEHRPALLERHFSAGLRERNGDASLLETFAMLADGLGPDLASLPPPVLVDAGQGSALHYRMPDGRRLSLTLVLSD
jgi:hypothetical protein